jgi:hypothetical protein
VKSEKPRLWLAILNSSIIAAVIAAGASYWALERNITASKELETIKSRLELEKDNARSTIATYNRLSQNLNTFAERLEGFADFVEISERDKSTPERAAHIQRELRSVGLSEQGLNDARNDSALNGTLVQHRVNECLEQLNPALSKARNDPLASLVPIRHAVQRFREIIFEIQRDISNQVSGIR